jgi:Fe-S-cluster-containing hydrogenase component 2
MIVHPETGARIIDPRLCIGCGACARACPFNKDGGVIGRKPRAAKEDGKSPWIYFKCDLCEGKPICIEECPTGALRLVELRKGD